MKKQFTSKRTSYSKAINVLIVTVALLAVSLGIVITSQATVPPQEVSAVAPFKYPTSLAKAKPRSIVDKYGYYNRECVSYVAYKVKYHYGLSFNNWGHAKNWPVYAKYMSWATLSTTPKVNSIAYSTKGKYGHVAWVMKVNAKTVIIGEYNGAKAHSYGVRTVPKTLYRYIHLKRAV